MSDQTPIPETESTPGVDDAVETAEIEQVRNLILSSHRDIVPELVQGESITELVASIDSARQAYTRIIDSAPKPVTIPAGGNAPVAFDIGTLPTSEKIRRGLASTRKD